MKSEAEAEENGLRQQPLVRDSPTPVKTHLTWEEYDQAENILQFEENAEFGEEVTSI